MSARFLTHKENFLLRLREDGMFETTSDLVAVYTDNNGPMRLVVPIGSTIRRPMARRARADLVRKYAGASDDAYLALLAADGAKRLRLTRTLLRVAAIWRKLTA